MRTHRAPSALASAVFAAAACLFALGAAATTARAQGSPMPGPPAPGNRDPFAEARERQRREAQLRSAEMKGAVKTDPRAAEAAAEQMREDFKNIQILRNKVVRHLLSEKPLDYKFIAGETAEINKRAGRLRTHLARDEQGGEKEEQEKQEKQVEISDAQVKDALVTMCKRIDSFTENPIFAEPDVVNVEQSAKAAHDLRDIIRLSGGIKRAAEKLNKSSKK